MKVVVIGGVAGGATAAARIRRLNEQAQIVIFERSGYISYANCGLPYYIGGAIEERKKLTLQTPQSFFRRYRVKARVRHEVVAIFPDRHTVSVKNLETGETFYENYDKLILSPGAKPIIPRLAGVDEERVFTLRTVEDALRIREYIDANQPRSVVIAGGGFIGLEMAENLRELGLETTIVQRPKQVLPNLDADMAAMLHHDLRRHGVDLKLGVEVEGFRREDDSVATALKDAEALRSDIAILAIGVEPDTALAKAAGLELGQKGAIVVNDKMQTSDPDVYAVGDAVEIRHYVTGAPAHIALAGPANKQARIAADNICGGDSRYKGAQGSVVLKLFDMTAAATGINEKTARAAGIDYDKVVVTHASHAGYYPGGKSLTLKVLWDKKTLKLSGAQIVGYDGVDKRVDVLATAIRCGMKAPELAELDLAYAPPYSSAKDPVNMAGYVIENVVEGKVKQFHWHDVAVLPKDGSVQLLDARTPEEYAKGSASGFYNIPLDELRDKVDALNKSKPVYIMCQSGLRSYIASRILTNLGFDVYNFSGGYGFYSAVVGDRELCEANYPCGMEK